MTKQHHTPITGRPNIKTAMNTVLGALDAAIGTIGEFDTALVMKRTTNGDGGSTSNATWNARQITADFQDDGNIISQASGTTFTPIAGRYLMMNWSGILDSDKNRMRLYNVTQNSVVGYGGSSDAGDLYGMIPMFLEFTANGTDVYRVDHYTETAKATTGMGQQDGQSPPDIHMQALIIRLGS